MATEQPTQMISAIIVVGNRFDALDELVVEYRDALLSTGRAFEIIVVLDGQRPEALASLEKARTSGVDMRIVRLTRAFGESTALMSGFDLARGRLILTLPAYYQVSAASIPQIIDSFSATDMTVVRREPRRGNSFERVRRSAFHWILGRITGMRFSDLGCSVRLMDRRILEELRLYGDQHRFLAVLARNAGFRVHEIAVEQSQKDEFRSRYRLREYLHRLLDIFTVFFLIRFTKKPLRFFGMIGGITFLIGAIILGIVVAERLFFGVALADRPAMLLSSLLVVLGLQLFSLGLLGELIIFTHARSLKEYKVDMIIGGDEEIPGEPTDEKSVA